jgi:hypothetical protein
MMKMGKYHAPCTALISVILAVGSCACGTQTKQSVPPAPSGCQSGEAIIAIHDGSLQAVCGCAEAPSGPVVPPATFRCTVDRQAVVFFNFQDTVLQHQILSTGSPNFQESPVSDPQRGLKPRVHAVKFDNSGTYSFHDAFNSGLSGAIVVR